MLCFIVNEHSRSGKGAKIWKEAEAVLKKKNIAYESYVTQYEGHAFSLAHDICECGADDIQLVFSQEGVPPPIKIVVILRSLYFAP